MRVVYLCTLLAASTAFAQESQPPAAAPQAKELPKGKLQTQEIEGGATEAPAVFGVGARFRFIWMPTTVLNLFLGHSTSMTSISAGGEVIRRKGNLDMVWGIEYANISPSDGLYLEKGKDPGQFGDYPDYLHFDNFSLISLDWSFIWHSDITPRFQFRYGAGIGVGFLIGNIQKYQQPCNPGTTADQLDDPNFCPVNNRATSPKLADIPSRVWPVVNVLAGLRYQIVDQVAVSAEIGFRDVFFGGLGLGYFF
jgi:hypothetical protein